MKNVYEIREPGYGSVVANYAETGGNNCYENQ